MGSPGLRWIAALLTGLVMAASQPPLTMWWLLPIGVAALFILWRKAENSRRAFWTGWIAGTAYFAGTMFWIVEPFLVEPEKFAWMIPVALPAMAGGLALFWGVALAVAKRVGLNGLAEPLVFATCWMVAEGLRSVVLTGFPWAQPGYSLVDVPPIQLAAYMGINGVTFLALLVGTFLGAVLVGETTARRIVFGTLALGIGGGAWAVGAARLAEPLSPRAIPLWVGMVQPNVPQTQKWHPDLRDAQLADLLQKTRSLSDRGADVVIWPEAATPFPIDEMPGLRATIAEHLQPDGVLLAGGIRVEGRGGAGQRVHNSLLAVGSDGAVLATYDKQHLVPFGEYVPFDAVLTRLGLRTVISLPGGFTSGLAQDRTIRIDTLPPFGVMICYEAIFPHEVLDRSSEAEWMVHVTNDAWFGQIAGPQQHLAQARVRAIERGLPIARTANTGITAMISARGQVVDGIELGKHGTLLHKLPAPTSVTVYSRYEEFTFIILVLSVLTIIALIGGKSM